MSHDERHKTAGGDRPASAEPARRGRLSSADLAVLAAQSLAGNAAVASALGEKERKKSAPAARPATTTTPDALALDDPHFDLQIPLGSFDHLLKGRRMRGHREVVERFDRQQGVMPLAWTAGTGALAQERNTRWHVHQPTLVATSTLRRFAAVGATVPDGPNGSLTEASALLAGLPRAARHGRGSVHLRYAGFDVLGGAARVTSRVPDDATIVVELAFAKGTLVMTGRRDAQGDHFDWDTEVSIDLDVLARVLWRDVFDRLETRRRGGVKKLKPAEAAADPPKKRRKPPKPEDDDTDRTEPDPGPGDEQGMFDEQS